MVPLILGNPHITSCTVTGGGNSKSTKSMAKLSRLSVEKSWLGDELKIETTRVLGLGFRV